MNYIISWKASLFRVFFKQNMTHAKHFVREIYNKQVMKGKSQNTLQSAEHHRINVYQTSVKKGTHIRMICINDKIDITIYSLFFFKNSLCFLFWYILNEMKVGSLIVVLTMVSIYSFTNNQGYQCTFSLNHFFQYYVRVSMI